MVLEATKVLGEDYTSVLKEAFNNRWIDVYPGIIKFQELMLLVPMDIIPSSLKLYRYFNDVFTIAHELGHGCTPTIAININPLLTRTIQFLRGSSFTVNEQLLLRYLLNKTTIK